MKILLVCLVTLIAVGAESSHAPRYRRSIEEVRDLAKGETPKVATSIDPYFLNWAECPDQSPKINGSCFKWSGQNDVANWFTSELKCRAKGGHLVSILSKEEHQIVQAITFCTYDHWIGLVNTEYANGELTKPSGWSWWDRGEHRYTRLSVTPNPGFDCSYAKADGIWVNSYCSQVKRSYVCKKPSSVLTPETVDDIKLTTTDLVATQETFKCPDNWIHYKNHCYYFSNTSVNYFHAHLYCFDFQAHVVTIKSAPEQNFVQAVNGCENRFWIGLERAIPCLSNKTRNQCWEWSDLSPVVYQNWRDKNPPEGNYECAFSNGFWSNTAQCHTQMRFVCKRAVQ